MEGREYEKKEEVSGNGIGEVKKLNERDLILNERQSDINMRFIFFK